MSHTHARIQIEDVQVDPDFQRRGLGTAMLTRILTTLAQQGAGPVRAITVTESDDWSTADPCA